MGPWAIPVDGTSKGQILGGFFPWLPVQKAPEDTFYRDAGDGHLSIGIKGAASARHFIVRNPLWVQVYRSSSPAITLTRHVCAAPSGRNVLRPFRRPPPRRCRVG